MRKRILSLTKFVVSFGLLIALLSRVEIQQAASMLATAHWPLLLLGLIIYITSIALRAIRWRALLEAQGIAVPLRRLISLYYVGGFFNIVLPTGMGGDAVRAYELSRDCNSGAISAGTVLADRAIGLLVLLLMAALVLPFSLHLLEPWLIVLVLTLAVGSFGGVALFLWSEPLRKGFYVLPASLRRLLDHPSLRKLYFSFRGYNRSSLAVAGAISIFFNLMMVAVNGLIGLSFGVRIGVGYYFISTSITSALLALPISLNGLGMREWGYMVLFGRVGVPAATAVSMSLASYLINVLSGLIGGVLYIWEGAHGLWRPTGGEL